MTNPIRNLKSLSDSDLLKQTKICVEKEREFTILVIEHLEEVEARRLYSKLGFASLWDYATHELGYCAGSAHRRIQAMRFSKNMPEVKEAIDSAKVSLTSVAMVQQFCKNQERMSKKRVTLEERRALLQKIEHKSSRETEKILRTISPAAMPVERERPLDAENVELKVVVDQETMELLNRMKELLSGTNPNPSTATAIKRALKIAVEKLDPKRKQRKSNSGAGVLMPNTEQSLQRQDLLPDRNEASLPAEASSHQTQNSCAGNKMSAHGRQLEPNIVSTRTSQQYPATYPITTRRARRRRIFISVHTKRALLEKAGYRCTFVSSLTGMRCLSTRMLQIEHKIPLAKGGSNEPENLTILCASHNLFRAVEEFGEQKVKALSAKAESFESSVL
ncbi:MAG: HNH endonuclease [Bdellovibrionota bacterium]